MVHIQFRFLVDVYLCLVDVQLSASWCPTLRLVEVHLCAWCMSSSISGV
jgi:hypothetical protein